jgi:hypothetical protein
MTNLKRLSLFGPSMTALGRSTVRSELLRSSLMQLAGFSEIQVIYLSLLFLCTSSSLSDLDVTPEQDWEQESSTRPHHAASPIPHHVPVEIIDLKVIDLTADD